MPKEMPIGRWKKADRLSQALGRGNNNRARRVTLKITGKRGKTCKKIVLVMRTPNGSGIVEKKGEGEFYDLLGELVIPRLPTFRIDGDTTFSTDLAENGVNYVFSANNITHEGHQTTMEKWGYEFKRREENDRVVQELCNIAKKLAQGDIELSMLGARVFYFIMNIDTGIAHVLVGDNKKVGHTEPILDGRETTLEHRIDSNCTAVLSAFLHPIARTDITCWELLGIPLKTVVDIVNRNRPYNEDAEEDDEI
ncbi:MAG: hypothetical protein ABL890_02325 [Candidatus Peribacteraceae bacterium]